MTIEQAASPDLPAPGPTGTRAMRVAIVLISNAIPLVGVLHYGWSAINVLVLYWLENLLVAIFACLRIAAHRRATRKRGHWREAQLTAAPGRIDQRPHLLGDYATIAFVFTLAHGIFVFAIAFILSRKHVDSALWQFAWTPFRNGALVLLATLAVDFGVDWRTLALRPFAWILGTTQQRMGRLLVLHLAIIAGMFAMGATSSPFGILYALIALKTLWDLAMTGAVEARASTHAKPPGWLLKIGARAAKGKGGASALAEHWTKAVESARTRGIEDELPMPR